MAKKKSPDVPPESLALYDAVIATNTAVQRKGAKSAYTSLNGHMFSFMTTDGRLCLRFSAAAQEAFVKKHGTAPVVQYGAVMRGYVEIPASMLKKTKQLEKHFRASFEYIGSLPPKATTRRKKTAKKKTAKKKTAKKKTAKKKTAKKKTAKKKR